VADENENVESEETPAEPETTDAPEGVADVENLPEETPDPDASAEMEASAEQAEPESTEEPAEGPPADEAGEAEASAEPQAEAEPTEEPVEGASEAEAEPAPVQPEPRKKKKRLPRSLRPQKTRRQRVPSGERRPIVRLPKPEHERGRTQERQGVVVSSGADKTIVVRVDVVKVHPMYKKVVKRSTKLHAHDEQNEAKVGDVVRIVETRPLSRMKRWRLQEIVEAAK
jgi:small subunit ribosomal protein S17